MTRKTISLIIVLITTCTFLECKKEPADQVTKQDIQGMVFNNCTDSGFAGVKVLFLTYKNGNQLYESVETISDKNGNFLFNNASIHSSSKYSYAVHIKSQSGTNAADPLFSHFKTQQCILQMQKAQSF